MNPKLEYWYWSHSDYSTYTITSDPKIWHFFSAVFYKLWYLIKAITAFAILSFLNAIMIRVGLMASSVILFAVSN
jgi:hypothetical protein